MSDNPFASPFGATTTNEVSDSQVDNEEEVTTETAPEVDGEEKPVKAKKERTRQNNRRKTKEEVNFILKNFKNMRASEIAKQLGLTPQQVTRTVLDAKAEYAKKAEQMPPEKAAIILAWIEENLPSKKDDFGKGGKRGTLIESSFDDIFADLL